MNPVYLLNELDLLKGNTALDVGTRDGLVATQLSKKGFAVDAIDVKECSDESGSFNFELISVEDFLRKNAKKYDIVVARHVLHLLNNPKEVLQGLHSISKVLFFTCFGPKDDWFGIVKTLSQEEVGSLFKPESIKHRSEAFQYGTTYSGETKFWHINTFVIDNRDI